MKRCPQCNSVFDDDLSFCTHDGTPLSQENFTLPSEFASIEPIEKEEETIIRREPLKIDFSTPDAPNRYIPPPENVAPIVVVKQRNTGKYLLFLIVGLILGGGLVLGVLLLGQNFYRKNNSNVAVNSALNNNREVKTPTATPAPAPTPNAEHLIKTSADEEDFNGRVIVTNANVRSSASKNAAPVTLLPMDDRLTIERRANEESPWYFITCEHGTSGWMHGDTIEFTQEAF